MKVGVVGCGRIATMVRLPILKEMKGINVVAIADVSKKRLHKAAEKFCIEEEYVDHNLMLEKAEVDAVFVCTPPATHFQIVMDSINRDKHVFCEKPLVKKVSEGLTIKRLLEKKRRKDPNPSILMPAHNFLFTPCYTKALQLVKNGEIGHLKEIRGQAISNLTFYGAKTDFRSQAKGGVIEDQLPHLVYLGHDVGGELDEVLSVEPLHKGVKAVDQVTVKAKLTNGALAVLLAKWTYSLSGFGTLKLELIGDLGQIEIDMLTTPYNVKTIVEGAIENINMGRRFRQYLDVLRSKHPSYLIEQQHFLRCVQGAEPARVSIDQGIELVRTQNEVMSLFEKSSYQPTGNEKAVILRAGNDVENTIQKSVDLLGGLNIKRNGLVTIKPNVCYPKNLQNMVLTDPRVLEGIITLVKSKTKNIVVIESDSTSGTAEKRLAKSGIMEVIEECGVEFLNLSEDEFEEHEVAGFTLQIPKTVMKSDFFINLPKLKTNDMMVLSIAMKNVFGVLANKKKARFHNQLIEVLTFLARTIRQDLIVVDGIVGMEGLGPIQGNPVSLGLIISGLNPVTVDAVCCHVIGFNPYAVETLWRSYKEGIGEIDLNRIDVLGERIENVKRKFRHPVLSPKNVATAIKTRVKLHLRNLD